MIKFKITIAIILLFLIGKVNAEDLFVGVLEQPQCKENSDLMVRIMFAKENDTWMTLYNQNNFTSSDFIKESWTIAFDGRNIGQIKIIELKTHDTPDNPRDILYKVIPVKKIPMISSKGEEFQGWCSSPKFRPLILVSKPNFKDPAKWKPFFPSKEFCIQLFPEFKKIIGKVERCIDKSVPNLTSYDYQAKDLIIFKSYKNILGEKLISIGLDPKKYNCDLLIGPEWSPHWFFIDKKDIKYIGNELTLVDAGDYDNDGKSEMIFWHSGYNEDGYSLFYNDFNSRKDFYWNYH